MKNTSHIHNLFVVICLLSLNLTFSQGNKQAKSTLFGNPKNIVNGHIRCATTEYEKFLQENNPKRMTNTQFEAWVTPLVKHYQSMRTTSQSGGVITIPVVVHVIHSGQAIGTAPNITDAQVQSQITILNQDYRKMIGTPGDNSNPVGADVQIEFAFALQDPNGNPTNGIDRISFCQENWSETEFDSKVKPATIWDPTLYMNMWTVKLTDNTVLGYAQFPDASGLSGLDASGGNANSDGVVSSYNVFGSITYDDGTFLLDPTYNKGRTMTHEVGHWLGLRHIWGDSTCGDDYCADTPVHHDANYGCPTIVNCDANGNEMVENYMDYTDDTCMNIFTQNQKDRITAVMNNSPRRSTLKTSTKNAPLTLFVNDAEVKLESSCPLSACGAVPNQTIQKITLYNRGTSNLTSATLNYNINNGTNATYNWTGNLATNAADTFDLTINSPINGIINIEIIKANGVADQRNSNNTSSETFTLPTAPTNYTINDFVFRLQQDEFGSETTWSLKNDSGTILYSGGSYTDTTPIPALITQNWTLANNQCYIFSINDTEGDGICCDFGAGYYDIKSSDGSILVASGASFATAAITTFSINLDVVIDSNDFYIYPNPTKELLNVKTPSNSGFLNSYKISNILGQIIKTETFFNVNDYTINTTSLSSGVYFIALEKGTKKKALRFIKE
ncbi:MAG: M43 family zinc metalloprotease [Flavobacterium sp.]|uniref:M43 family zinc metalloprotease n=1 Tax=Flavobacterium sp. TaxID=239 RepID=UPI0026378732|nr:M43 family zinc metalloprotease [Flavobacterium sp.]MDD5148878.1 M43 family zinc metalloprotease [Flavobacterium sp.]